MTVAPAPDHILQIGTGFMASKTLLSAVELELFTALSAHPMKGAALADELGLHHRSRYDFLDALVALGLLDREGEGPDASYSNTPDTAFFLDKNSPAYLGGILEMANARLYPFWSHLTEGLQTGKPQNEAKGGGDFFGVLYSSPGRLEQFLAGMQGIQLGNFMALLEKVDLASARTLVDVGGANGTFCALAAQRHPELATTVFDLPVVVPIAQRNLAAMGLGDRVNVVGGDFFAEDLPEADVIVMGNILHDWDLDQKKTLIAKAHKSLTPGGRLIAVENVIDDARRSNAFGLLMSLNMLIEVPGGFDYTGAQYDAWCREVGFARTEIVPLAGPASAAIAYKE